MSVCVSLLSVLIREVDFFSLHLSSLYSHEITFLLQSAVNMDRETNCLTVNSTVGSSMVAAAHRFTSKREDKSTF